MKCESKWFNDNRVTRLKRMLGPTIDGLINFHGEWQLDRYPWIYIDCESVWSFRDIGVAFLLYVGIKYKVDHYICASSIQHLSIYLYVICIRYLCI